MSIASVANQLCVFFGGPYVAAQHSYRTPQITVPNASPVVRRAAPKRDDHIGDYFAVPVEGVTTVGCLILIELEEGAEARVAGGTPGMKEVDHRVTMHCFLKALDTYAEDMQDSKYALVGAIRTRIESDRTAGSGGFEAGFDGSGTTGFQIAEATQHGQPWLRWHMSPVVTTPREQSKAYMSVEFDAVEFLQA